jgi:HAE1 family hydrophobic/amphiphilic exporter-1
VRVRDLGDAIETLEKRRSFVRSKGEPSLALPVFRESGSNVMSVMQELHKRIDQVNEQILPLIGPKLSMIQVYDETDYIGQAISLVINNLWLGRSRRWCCCCFCGRCAQLSSWRCRSRSRSSARSW